MIACSRLIFAMVLFAAGVLHAVEVDYARDIKPILSTHCYKCHGPEKQTHQLRLDQRAYVMVGGDSGDPAVIPGKPDQSHLIQLVTAKDPKQRMPRKGEPLTDGQVALLKQWIAAGAPMPGDDTMQYKRQTGHWSLQPLTNPQPPQIDPQAANPIDAFVLAKLHGKGLSMSQQADRRTLIRRLYLVMLGLPPTPAQVDAFVVDPSPNAYEALVDQVLASPRYGERWAQHWLDVVRYADTHGFEMNQPRHDAFGYRDWVIEALNRDLPYDQFVFQQIAGDSVGADAATGFLVAGAWDQVKGQDPKLRLQQRADELHDIVSVTSEAMLGLTVGCARCHNHKFDPILQKDYYAIKAVFEGVQHGSHPIQLPEPERERRRKLSDQVSGQIAVLERDIDLLGGGEGEINPRRNVDRFEPVVASRVRFTIYATNNGAQPCLDELEIYSSPLDGAVSTNVALASAGAKATASSVYPGNKFHQIVHLNDGRHGNEYSWISSEAGVGWAQIDLPAPVRIDRVIWGRDRHSRYEDRVPISYVIQVAEGDGPWHAVASSLDRQPGRFVAKVTPQQAERVKQLQEQKKQLEQQLDRYQQLPTVYAGRFEQPAPTHRLYRGDPMAPREVVAPDVISILGSLSLPADAPDQQRRIAFAKWVIDPANPLTARVMVNRIWQHQFGVGLVDTPSDFGGNGTPPSHPALLDYLAGELIRSGWSIKHMHRLILTSRSFMQSTAPDEKAMAIDRDARLLWRYPSRRLEAEAIRDSMLAVAGVLDLNMGGPGFSLFQPNENYVRVYEPKTQWGPGEFRRMIYARKVRMEGGPVFGAFDCPDAGQSQPRRPRSTTAIQALNLLNSTFTMTVAERLADRITAEAGPDVPAQIDYAFRLVDTRSPTEPERSIARQLVADQGLTALTRVMLNTNEFLFIP